MSQINHDDVTLELPSPTIKLQDHIQNSNTPEKSSQKGKSYRQKKSIKKTTTELLG